MFFTRITETDYWDAIAPEQVQKIIDYELLFGSLYAGVLSTLYVKAIALLDEVLSNGILSVSGKQKLIAAIVLMRSHKFLKTIHRNLSVRQRIEKGKVFSMQVEDIKQAISSEYFEDIILTEWALPPGAFNGDAAGPS